MFDMQVAGTSNAYWLYYRANLTRCAQLPDTGERSTPGRRRHRSPMAEALTNQLSSGAVEARRAGSHPRRPRPNTVAVMRSHGLDLGEWAPATSMSLAGQQFTTWSPSPTGSGEVCPESPARPGTCTGAWRTQPRRGTERESYPAFERAAAA